jgi:hypothetical protein
LKKIIGKTALKKKNYRTFEIFHFLLLQLFSVNIMLSYRVLYITKDNHLKKRKVYQDGTIKIQKSTSKELDSFEVTLVDVEGSDVRKATMKDASIFRTGEEVPFLSFFVQVEELVVDNNSNQLIMSSSIEIDNESIKKSKILKQYNSTQKIQFSMQPSTVKFKVPVAPAVPANANAIASMNCINTVDQSHSVYLDSFLLRQMRPHQVEGANFLINCLQSKQSDNETTKSYNNNDEDDGENFYMSNDNKPVQCTGAILADEVRFCLSFICYLLLSLFIDSIYQ